MTEISFNRLDSRALPPRRAHEGDAGFDLCTIDEVVLRPGERAAVGTGLAVALPSGTAGLVMPRSGHAARHGIGIVNSPGLVDSGYRGEIRVLLINHGTETVVFAPGERVAQFVVVNIPEVQFFEVDELESSTRGTGGFGSTGR